MSVLFTVLYIKQTGQAQASAPNPTPLGTLGTPTPHTPGYLGYKTPTLRPARGGSSIGRTVALSFLVLEQVSEDRGVREFMKELSCLGLCNIF